MRRGCDPLALLWLGELVLGPGERRTVLPGEAVRSLCGLLAGGVEDEGERPRGIAFRRCAVGGLRGCQPDWSYCGEGCSAERRGVR